jgi:hypothetical protein
MTEGVLFLVCAETRPGAGARRLEERLNAWNAARCFGPCWLIAANTTSRVVYDSLAEAIGDRDRLLVCELDEQALWYNLRPETDELLHPRLPA